jgi:acyl carrier protein
MPQLDSEAVLSAVKEVIGPKRRRGGEITVATKLEELDLDSLEVAELFNALEERSGCEFDPDSARSLETVGDLVRLREI